MDLFFIIIQIILLAAIGITLWQIWKYLHSKAIADDEPLGEARAKYITDRLNIVQILVVVETIVFIVHSVLRFIEQLD